MKNQFPLFPLLLPHFGSVFTALCCHMVSYCLSLVGALNHTYASHVKCHNVKILKIVTIYFVTCIQNKSVTET